MYTEIYVDISNFNRDTKRSNVTRQNAKKHKVISSLNKCSTENVLNWCPFYFVTATVLLDVFSSAKSRTTFRRSSGVAFARCALHGALSCINTKSQDLNR